MGWVFYTARDSFENYRTGWDEINRRCGNNVLLDSIFVGSLVRHFASDQTLLGIDDANSNPAMLIVNKVRPGFWQTFQQSQGPLGLILLENQNAAEPKIA